MALLDQEQDLEEAFEEMAPAEAVDFMIEELERVDDKIEREAQLDEVEAGEEVAAAPKETIEDWLEGDEWEEWTDDEWEEYEDWDYVQDKLGELEDLKEAMYNGEEVDEDYLQELEW